MYATRDTCEALEARGLFDGRRLELIEGRLINKMGASRAHTNARMATYHALCEIFGPGHIEPSSPIDVAPEENFINEPTPDWIVVGPPSDSIVSRNPCPADLRLVVEVADASLHHDLTTKAGLYARANIVEYWVVDIQGQRIVVHREPANGDYRSVVAYDPKDCIAPLSAPSKSFPVAAVFSPPV